MPGPFSPLLINISSRGRLRFTGEDRVRFLNGQATNDIAALQPGDGCYAVFANGKGKARADAVILNRGDCLLADLEPGCDTRLTADLERYLIADDVQIENVGAAWKAWTLIGEAASHILVATGICGKVCEKLFNFSPPSPSAVFRAD